MKQGDIGWSEARRQSSRTLAYYYDCHGKDWTSIREAAHSVAAEFGIKTAGKRRSQIAVECLEVLTRLGVCPPPSYSPPWHRNGAAPRLFRSRKPLKDEVLMAFYESFEWKRLRFDILRERGRRCECCGADNRQSMIHVDHIKPVKKHWNLRLDPTNLQVLCEGCNRGKGSRYETDFREDREKQIRDCQTKTLSQRAAEAEREWRNNRRGA